MATRIIEEDENAGGGGNFVKQSEVFQKIGAAFTGDYYGEYEGKFGIDFKFKVDGEDKILNGSKNLRGQMNRAKLKGDGSERVTVLFSAEKDVGQASPMRLFRLKVVESGVPVPRRVEQPKPAPKDEFGDEAFSDDIPF